MEQLLISNSPHVRSSSSTKRIMLDVIIALLPATVMGIIYFGLSALLVLALSVFFAVLSEVVYKLIFKQSIRQIIKEFDYTSVVTGLLLGLNLSSKVPVYVPIFGAVFAIIVVKMFFGGTGKNLVNPAIAARVFLLIAFAAEMTEWAIPSVGYLNGASPTAGQTELSTMLAAGLSEIKATPLDMLLGTGISGCIGETCKLALIVGGAYLMIRKVIDFKPLIYIVVTGLMGVLYAGTFKMFLPSILSGGLFLGAIFMATDYVTSPNTRIGSFIYYIALGVLTGLLRSTKGMEMVSYCILLMNLTVPLIDRFLVPKPFGYSKPPKVKKEKKEKTAEVKTNG